MNVSFNSTMYWQAFVFTYTQLFSYQKAGCAGILLWFTFVAVTALYQSSKICFVFILIYRSSAYNLSRTSFCRLSSTTLQLWQLKPHIFAFVVNGCMFFGCSRQLQDKMVFVALERNQAKRANSRQTYDYLSTKPPVQKELWSYLQNWLS